MILLLSPGARMNPGLLNDPWFKPMVSPDSQDLRRSSEQSMGAWEGPGGWLPQQEG